MPPVAVVAPTLAVEEVVAVERAAALMPCCVKM